MNQKNINLLASELAFYEIHDHGYDPIKNITNFWTKYDIIDIRKSIEVLFKKNIDNKNKTDVLELCAKQVFSVDLTRLLLAYFLVHIDHIDITHIDISESDTAKSSIDELEITKRVHGFFANASQDHYESE